MEGGDLCVGRGPRCLPRASGRPRAGGCGPRLGFPAAEVAGRPLGVGRSGPGTAGAPGAAAAVDQPLTAHLQRLFAAALLTTFAPTWQVGQGAAATKVANPGLDGEKEGI